MICMIKKEKGLGEKPVKPVIRAAFKIVNWFIHEVDQGSKK